METLLQDLKYGARSLLNKPGFTIVAIFTLALGIGANTAIFTVINTVLLGPLPFKQPERLVVLWETMMSRGVDQVELAPDDYFDYRDRSSVFSQIGAAERVNVNMTGRDEPVRLEGREVTASLFATLGVLPLLGRTFTEEEDKLDARVVVLSYKLWQSRFGGDRNVVGGNVTLNGRDFTVIGVMPAGFQLPATVSNDKPTEIWIPRSLETETSRTSHNLVTIARLKEGVTFAQARAELESIARLRAQETTRSQGGTNINLVPIQAQAGRQLRPALKVLAGAVGFVLLIACANVANLLLSRAASRQKEIAVRLALGASRWRIVRQILTESLLLSLCGAAVGLLLAVWLGETIRVVGSAQIPRADQIGIDARVLGFTVLLSLMTGVVFGIVPALQASRPDLHDTLKEGGRGATGGRQRIKQALVVSQIALSLVLLIGAGLMIKSFWRLQQVNPGFDPKNLLSVEITLPAAKYAEQSKRAGFYQEALEKIAALPGVKSAAIVNHPPFSGRRGVTVYRLEGKPEPTNLNDTPMADFRVISPDYFQMMGIPVIQGRAFDQRDASGAAPVTIINKAFAERYWPGEDPLGRRISTDNQWAMVIGIVGNVKQSGLDAEASPHVYLPYRQLSISRTGLLVRTAADSLGFVGAVRNQIQAIDPDLPIYNVQTMEGLIDASVSQRRLNLLLLGLFALVALSLATVGIYGVMSYTVTHRTHEIGIRMALGANPQNILRLITSQGMRLVAIGIGLGLAGALALTRIMSTLLYGVSATDPATFTTIALLLVFVALLACIIPASKAAKVDPMVALRYE
jgi:putative ABC transport system permease protein